MPLELLSWTTRAFGRLWTWAKLKVGLGGVVDASGWEPFTCLCWSGGDVTEVGGVVTVMWGS